MSTSSKDYTASRVCMALNNDYISDLPDGIITDILSCLPAKDAGRTCTLSNNWQHRWLSIYNIVINDVTQSSTGNTVNKSTFVDFVNRILLDSSQTSEIISFKFTSRRKYGSELTAWISAALRRKVQILEMEAFGCETIDFPGDLSSCTSLTKLKLFLTCRLQVSVTSCFSHLKSLYIVSGPNRTTYIQCSNSGQIFLVFPILEILEMQDCRWLNVSYVEIKAPELISFKTLSGSSSRLANDHVIKIYGAKLSEFDSAGFGLIENFVLCSPSLYFASMNHRHSDHEVIGSLGLQVNKILKEISSIKCLELSGQTVKGLIQAKPQHALPSFDQVKLLTLGDCDNREWMEFLHVVPSLDLLELCSVASSSEHFDFEQVESLPLCISRLKEVTFVEFHGEGHEIEAARFFLKNANNLEKMSVYCRFNPYSPEALRKKMSELFTISNRVSFVVCGMKHYQYGVYPRGL